MRLLVTGATGQIGYALVHALARTEHAVTVLVRDARKLPFPDNVRVIEHPQFTAEGFAAALEGVDHVVYGIGLPEQFRRDTAIFERVNVGLLETFLGALQAAGVRPLTYISAYEVFRPDVDGAIRETQPLADGTHMTPYFRSMIRAYRSVTTFAAERDLPLTTIHPAAVYGGVEASPGITRYINDVAHWRLWKVPVIVAGRFPVVHVDSLADGIRRAMGHRGAYIISDGMTDLKTIARTVRQHTRAYVPPEVPVAPLVPAIRVLEALARVTRRPPIMSRVQVKFITAGWEPHPGKIISQHGWQPLPLAEGIRRCLAFEIPQ